MATRDTSDETNPLNSDASHGVEARESNAGTGVRLWIGLGVLLVAAWFEPWNVLTLNASRGNPSVAAAGGGKVKRGPAKQKVIVRNESFATPAMMQLIDQFSSLSVLKNPDSLSTDSDDRIEIRPIEKAPDIDSLTPNRSAQFRELFKGRRFEGIGDAQLVTGAQSGKVRTGVGWVLAGESDTHKSEGANKDGRLVLSRDQLAAIVNDQITPLTPLRTAPGGAGFGLADTAAGVLYNFLIPYIHEVQVDSKPLMVDFGCTVGRYFSEGNPNSIVLCVHRSKGALLVGSQRVNLLDFQTTSFTAMPFANFYRTCNMLSTVYIRPGEGRLDAPKAKEKKPSEEDETEAAVPGNNKEEAMAFRDVCEELQQHVSLVMPMSKTLFVEIPLHCVKGVYKAINNIAKKSVFLVKQIAYIRRGKYSPYTPKQSARAESAPAESSGNDQSSPVLDAEVDMTLDVPEKTYLLIRVTMYQHQRPECSKIWGKAYDVGSRRTSVEYEQGLTTIRVYDISSKTRSKLMRKIHPLIYMVCISLDTILSMGITRNAAERYFGMMVQTPFYSDPPPHNWILVGGGKVLRIDKHDPAYLKKRPESAQYWYRSSRGYFHLLGFHLCLPIHDTIGIPKVATVTACRTQCLICLQNCTYLPRGTKPCPVCNRCGDCILNHALTDAPTATRRDANGSPLINLGVPKPCLFEGLYKKHTGYWTEGKRQWKKWEESDNNNPLPEF